MATLNEIYARTEPVTKCCMTCKFYPKFQLKIGAPYAPCKNCNANANLTDHYIKRTNYETT